MSSAVATMVADISGAARRSAGVPIDPGELEHYTHYVLSDLARSRPRIIDYLPELALNQVLALLGLRKHPEASHALAAEPTDICRSSRQHCWPVSGTEDGTPICRCSGRTPVASAWYARLPWRTARGAEAPA
jgi:hypothetical protein